MIARLRERERERERERNRECERERERKRASSIQGGGLRQTSAKHESTIHHCQLSPFYP